MAEDIGVATGIASFGVWQVYNAYTSGAPKLAALRAAPADDWLTRQQLWDADIMVGSMVAIAGVTCAVIARKVWPLALLALAFTVVVYYSHSALNGPHPTEETEDK